MTDRNEFAEKLALALTKNELSEFVTDEITDKLFALTERMLEVNEYMNLTAIRDLDGVVVKHYADSLTVAKYIPEDASVIDVGCGAGFPSLPLAIARPDLKITALDSTAKRINYIRETAEMLGLKNITAIAARAEEAAHDASYREKYDIACARAVARLNVLSELCMGFVRQDGYFLAMKSHSADEVSEAAGAIEKLGGKLEKDVTFSLISLSDECEQRSIVCIKKLAATPKNYPRNNSQIKKKPL